jgi:hypothetical protein
MSLRVFFHLFSISLKSDLILLTIPVILSKFVSGLLKALLDDVEVKDNVLNQYPEKR